MTDREQFEKWWDGAFTSGDPEEKHTAWCGWQAARATPAPIAGAYPSNELELEWYAEWQQMPGQQHFSLQEYSHYVIRKACDWVRATPALPQGEAVFEAACSGLRYANPKACGEVSAIHANGVRYTLAELLPLPQGVEDDWVAGLRQRLNGIGYTHRSNYVHQVIAMVTDSLSGMALVPVSELKRWRNVFASTAHPHQSPYAADIDDMLAAATETVEESAHG